MSVNTKTNILLFLLLWNLISQVTTSYQISHRNEAVQFWKDVEISRYRGHLIDIEQKLDFIIREVSND